MYETITINGYTFGRINKAQARKLYKDSENEIYMIPSNMSLSNIIVTPARLYPAYDFEMQVNAYMFYNCNHQTGYYPHYWYRIL